MKSKISILTLAITLLPLGQAGVFAQGQTQSGATAGSQAKPVAQPIPERKIPGLKLTAGIPVNFPVPKYTSNVINTTFSNSTKGSPTAAANIVTKDEPQKVFDWYQSTMKSDGWNLKVPTAKAMAAYAKSGQFFMLRGSKGKNEVSVFVIKPERQTNTAISISWAQI
jgi:hypothetical protein